MTTTPVPLRRVLAGALVLPLTGLALVAIAPPASAAVTSPGNGTVFASHTTIRINASFTASGSENVLTLTSPDGAATQIRRVPANRLSGGSFEEYLLDTNCWTSETCSGTRIAPNGTWTITQSGSNGGPWSFVTRIAPRAPQSVTATELSPREARVSWRKGDEPDLTGWQVLEGDGVAKDVGLSACDATSCSAVIGYPADGTGAHTYAVRALRSTAPGSGTALESPPSSPASVTLAAPAPSPEPAPDGGASDGGASDGDPGTAPTDGSTGAPSGGGSTGGSGTAAGGSTGGNDGNGGNGGATTAPFGSGTTTGGQSADANAVAQRKAFALGFSSFGPKLGIPKLPPLPQQSPALAPELADGTYEPTLGFEDQVVSERVETTGPTAAVRTVVGSALDSERLATSTAGALLLLLAGAHLRRWLGATSEE